MKVSELIEKLEKLKLEVGDLTIYASHDADDISIIKCGYPGLESYLYLTSSPSFRRVIPDD